MILLTQPVPLLSINNNHQWTILVFYFLCINNMGKKTQAYHNSRILWKMSAAAV